MSDVFVVGSINQDFVLKVQRRPEPGETVTDAELDIYPGGKGANQATAAARLGASVALLGRVGDEVFCDSFIELLQSNGIDTTYVNSVYGTSTGAAFITVTPDGENTIVVSPGANRMLQPSDVTGAAKAIQKAKVLVAQLEIRVEAVEKAAQLAAEAGCRVLLNLAPVCEVPASLLRLTDPLVVNEHEAAYLLKRKVSTVQEAKTAAHELLDLGPRSAVITMGDAGAVLAEPGETPVHLPAPRVTAVDTTGAGDAFIGALAARLAKGDTLVESVAYAVKAGAVAVTRPGAQVSMPAPEDVDNLV